MTVSSKRTICHRERPPGDSRIQDDRVIGPCLRRGDGARYRTKKVYVTAAPTASWLRESGADGQHR